MYKPYKDWLSFIELNDSFPFALTYKLADNIKPIVSISTIQDLCGLIQWCNKHNYDYDYTTGKYDLNNYELDQICVLTGYSKF